MMIRLALLAALFAAPASAESRMIVYSEIVIWAEPQRAFFVNPDTHCRFIGTSEGSWPMQITTQICGDIASQIDAKVAPLHSVPPGMNPMMRAGQQAVLIAK